MIKISCKQDWRDFIEDVWDELGKRGKYVKGHFAASLTGDDLNLVCFDGDFYTRFKIDDNGRRFLEAGFDEYENPVWKDPDVFFHDLANKFKKPFYICDPGYRYHWF